MEFIKDLLLIQQELIVKEMSTKLYKEPLDKQNFIIKYNKKNFTSVKLVKNDPIYNNIKKTNCVQKDNLLSTL
tara:strand:- start:31 stop:249 length:219 start_codon:yes stop_codon:yes gene_type:complete